MHDQANNLIGLAKGDGDRVALADRQNLIGAFGINDRALGGAVFGADIYGLNQCDIAKPVQIDGQLIAIALELVRACKDHSRVFVDKGVHLIGIGPVVIQRLVLNHVHANDALGH